MLTGATRLTGLLGNPVAHSLSPRMQNAAFAARGLDWAYVPLPVAAERLEAALAGLAALGFAGVNVTIPHKTAVLGFCDELDPFAERAGSVNTIVVRDERLLGTSTDGLAVTGAVEARGARLLLLGAGGAAQAVATALADEGVETIVVAARRPDAAHALAGRLRAVFADREIEAAGEWPPSPRGSTLVVNATPLTAVAPVEPSPGQTVVDLAYRGDGRPTALVAAARARGCVTVDGVDVLVRQGAASFERWTRIPAPVEVMRAALTSAG